VPSRSNIAAFGKSSVVGANDPRVPVGVISVLRHVPVQVRRAVVPPCRPPFAERPLNLVHGPVRGGLRLAVARPRPSGAGNVIANDRPTTR